ncbi:MAG: DUF5309 domain-containing protein, partial [Gammaproteobacteria bacterium]|nr:DUF5309 domain-containing protein [Gammaproteobacteria bacterium]
SYQIIMRQRELRRDVEAIMLTAQASRADNGTLAGLSAGLNSWITDNDDRGSGATAAGFSSGVVAAATTGTTRTLTETLIRQAIEDVYIDGGDSAVVMGIPELIRRISQYMFTSSARIATLMSDQGKSAEKATAMGSVNVFVSDFGTVELIPNRLMPITNSGAGTENTELFVLDPMYLAISYLQGYETEPLAKTGTSENRMMTVDWTLCVKNNKAQAIVSEVPVLAKGSVTYPWRYEIDRYIGSRTNNSVFSVPTPEFVIGIRRFGTNSTVPKSVTKTLTEPRAVAFSADLP